MLAVWGTALPFASQANFIGPLYDKDGNPIALKEHKELLEQVFKIVQRSNLRYSDVLNMSYADRISLMQMLADELKTKQELIDSKTHKLE